MLIFNNDRLIGPWVASRIGTVWNPQQIAIGVWTPKGQGGVLYENWNGRNIFAHIAGEGEHWITREFLWYIFYYPFEELGCERITAVTNPLNLDAQRLLTRFGFELETRLIEAHPDGDLLVYRLRKSQCRWHLLEPYYGKSQQAKHSELRRGGGENCSGESGAG